VKKTEIGGALHRSRHAFCAQLAMVGAPRRRIQIIVGQAGYKTTEMYAHLCPAGGASEVMKFSL